MGNMKTNLLLALGILLIIGAGCSGKKTGTCDNCIPGPETVIIKYQQKKTVFNCCADQLPITFDSVYDSRCPLGAECFWAGTATIHIRPGTSGTDEELLWQIPKKISYLNHSYTLKLVQLNPVPSLGVPYDVNKYEATIVVNRN